MVAQAPMPKTLTAAVSRSDWRLILLASLGGALEFYDFVVYSQFAQYIGRNFYPNDDPTVSLIVSFSVFAVGYFARPLGGIFFGHIGDRIGRRRVLIITILTMSAATAGIGLLPTYADWGITASVLLVALRIIQGFCLGGELPGAISYVVETAPRRFGFSVGVIFFCVNTGVALAALLNLVVHETLTVEEIGAWGWRIGFLVGGALGIISFFLRLRLEESKEFARIRARAGASAVPFAELMCTRPTAVAVGVAILAVTAGFNGLLFAMPAFLPQTMGYEAVTAIEAQNVALAILSAGLLLVAWFSDRVSRKALALTGATLLLLLAWPFFKAAQDHSVNLLGAVRASGCSGVDLRGHGHRYQRGSFPDTDSLLRSGAELQLELYVLQRSRTRRRNIACTQLRDTGDGRVLHDRLRASHLHRGARDAQVRWPNPRRSWR